MASFSWAANVSGDWNTGTLWTPISVPNTAAADVMIDAAATLAAYTVTIASGKTGSDGVLNLMGPGPVTDLGGASAPEIVVALFGWTGLNFDGPNEWTGSENIGAGSVDIFARSDQISTDPVTNHEILATSLFGAAMLNSQAGSAAIAGTISINDVNFRDYRTVTSSNQVLTPVMASTRTRPS